MIEYKAVVWAEMCSSCMMQNLLADYCCGGTSGASARPQQSLYANKFSFA
jgi:hypothetical protein